MSNHQIEALTLFESAYQVFDDLWLRAVPLTSRSGLRSTPEPTDLRIAIQRGSHTRPLMVQAPFVVRGLQGIEPDEPVVAKVSVAIASLGGMLLADSTTFSKLPVSNLPLRICAVGFDSMPSTAEFQSADAIEIQCIDDCRGHLHRGTRSAIVPKWPLDVPDVERLSTKIQLMRQLAGIAVPVGIAILAGNIPSDIDLVARSGADFVSLLTPMDSSMPATWIASSARQAAAKSGSPDLSIWVESAVRDGWDIAKLIACGASAVILDPLVCKHASNEALPTEILSPSGIRKHIGLEVPQAVVDAFLFGFRDKLAEMTMQIRTALEMCGCVNIAELNINHLTAASERAHRMSGASLISHV